MCRENFTNNFSKVDYYNELIENAKHHKYLYHNTSIESLSLILKNRSLKLSRLDKINDADENKRIKSPWNNRVFVACFSHETQSEKYFFEKYGVVRLTFKTVDVDNIKEVFFDAELKNPVPIYNKNIRCKDLSWGLYNRITADIKYVDDLDKYVLEDGTETNAGLIKKISGYDDSNNIRNWNEEYETRVRAAVKPFHIEVYPVGLNEYNYYNPEFDSLFMRLPEIEGIKVSPVITEEGYDRFDDLLKQYNLKSKVLK